MLCAQALRTKYALSLTVFFVGLIYLMLAITTFASGVKYPAATRAIIAGSLAFYVGFADFTNEIHDEAILPLFPYSTNRDDYTYHEAHKPGVRVLDCAVEDASV
jgi:succinate-acetate transporter protein